MKNLLKKLGEIKMRNYTSDDLSDRICAVEGDIDFAFYMTGNDITPEYKLKLFNQLNENLLNYIKQLESTENLIK